MAFLVEETHSPTRERIRGELEKMFPRMRWCVYDPLRSEAQNFATQISFGDNLRLVPRIERADVILALDSDFLDCGEGDIASSRAFSFRRRVSSGKDSMNRLYVVENRYTLTGAMADHRLRLPASQIPLVAHAIATRVATATKDSGLGSILATLQVPAGAAQFDEQWLDEAANDLVSKSGAGLVLAGPQQPVVVQLLAYGINSALKNVGSTVLLRERHRNQRDNSILQLAGDIVAGRIKQLFILGANPVFNAPRSLAYDSHTQELGRLARASKKGARCNPARLLRRRNFRAFSLESSRITFPGIVGRCAQLGRALPGYPTDDSPAFWRVLRA